jgi:hypothetical protein
MKILQETTDWEVPNHTYFVTDGKDKMFAYVKASGDEVQEFTKPIPFSTSHRKFKEIDNIWNFKPREEVVEAKPGKEYRVPGSAGNIYTVTDDAGTWSCTCPASKWQKGDCKHIKELKLSQTV